MTAEIYVGTYAKYNNGNLNGDWLDITNMTAEEFEEACIELHDDEEYPEFMYQDTNLPDILSGFVTESNVDEQLFTVIEWLERNNYDVNDSDDMLRLYKEACVELNYEGDIFTWDELECELENMKPVDAFRLALFSTINWSDDYYRYDGYGNLESTSSPEKWIDNETITSYLKEL